MNFTKVFAFITSYFCKHMFHFWTATIQCLCLLVVLIVMTYSWCLIILLMQFCSFFMVLIIIQVVISKDLFHNIHRKRTHHTFKHDIVAM